MIDTFLDRCSFWIEISVFFGTFALVFRRREHFFLRSLLGIAVGMVVSLLLPTQLPYDYGRSQLSNIIISSLYPRYIILFAIGVFVVWFILECSKWEAMFVMASAYCMQHIVYKSYSSLDESLRLQFSSETILRTVNLLCRPIIFFACLVLFWFFYAKKLKQLGGFSINNRDMVFLTIIIITAANILNSYLYVLYFTYPADDKKELFLICYAVFPLLLCFLCLVSLLDGTYRQTINENYLKSQALYEKMKLQYEQSKQNAETINIKYHDLKRFLEKSSYSRDALQDIYAAVKRYEEFPKTGNNALNIVLNEKLSEMKNAGIEFRSNISAASLAFMLELDVYSFFSNLLSNAIEHLASDKDAPKYISLDVSQKGEMIRIFQENGLSAEVRIDQSIGLPQTNKPDRQNHGFGTKSMRETVERYHGNILFDASDDKFTVIAMIPLPKSS